jgi:hypothetical protein
MIFSLKVFPRVQPNEDPNYLRRRRNHNAAAPKPANAPADGSGAGLMAMPQGLFNPEISDALTAAPEVEYSPTVPFPFARNTSFPEIAMPQGANAEINDALTVVPDVVYSLSDNVFHNLLPRPRCQLGISGVQINFRQSETDAWLAFRFVHGVNLLVRFTFHPRLEAHRIARRIVENIPRSPGAFELAIALRHILRFHFVRIWRLIFSRIRAVGVSATCPCRIVSES